MPLEHVCDGYQEQWDNCPGGLPVNMPAQSPEKSTLVDQWYWDVMGNSKPIATINLPINYGKKSRCYTQIAPVSQQPFRGFFFPWMLQIWRSADPASPKLSDRPHQAPTNDFCDPPKRPWLQFVVHSRLIFGVPQILHVRNLHDFSQGFFPRDFSPGIFPRLNVVVPLTAKA